MFGNQFTTLDHGFFFYVAQFKLENQPQLSRNGSVGGASDCNFLKIIARKCSRILFML